MAENEVELWGELGLAPKIGARFTRRWTSRGTRVLEQVEEDTGLTRAELDQRCADDERVEDLLVRAMQRAVVVGDVFYREALGHALAAAFDGSTAIDEAELLIDQLISLDPTALRVLDWLYSKLDYANQSVSPPGWGNHGYDDLDLSDQVVTVAFARLLAVNMLFEAWAKPEASPMMRKAMPSLNEVKRQVKGTEWGMRAWEICVGHRAHDPGGEPPAGA